MSNPKYLNRLPEVIVDGRNVRITLSDDPSNVSFAEDVMQPIRKELGDTLSGVCVTVDLEPCDALSSADINEIIRLNARLKNAGASMKVINVQEIPCEYIQRLRLQTLLNINPPSPSLAEDSGDRSMAPGGGICEVR
ncbi:MAG: hypothetical protein PHZ00_00585 [Candidatus Peribacteraceae bacterium]|nr:hypothetical protein [Candidatus Peribacteraceae bacterium]